MTKTLPGSVGSAHQPFRRSGVGRAFGERLGQLFPSGNLITAGTRQRQPLVASTLTACEISSLAPCHCGTTSSDDNDVPSLYALYVKISCMTRPWAAALPGVTRPAAAPSHVQCDRYGSTFGRDAPHGRQADAALG
jgi:hypothetical protein